MDSRCPLASRSIRRVGELQVPAVPRPYAMKNSLAVKILRGSLFLVIALISSFVPKMLGLPETTQHWADIATTLALFMQGVIWANIIISYYLQRYVRVYATDGSSITTFKALGALARL